MIAAAIGLILVGAIAGLYLVYVQRVRWLAAARLVELVAPVDAEKENREQLLIRTVRSFPPRYRFAPPSIALLAALALWLLVGLPVSVAVAGGILIGVLSYLIEEHLAEQRAATIEGQIGRAHV